VAVDLYNTLVAQQASDELLIENIRIKH